MNKYLLLGFVFLFLTTISFAADGCQYGENCTWYAYGADTADGVNISFSYENETTTEEFAMVSLGSGKYLYTTTHNVSGNVMGCARSYNSTSTIDTACESKEIYQNEPSILSGGSGMSLAPFVLLFGISIFCALLLFVTFKLGKEHAILKFFLLLVVLTLTLLIPKAGIDSNQNCSVLPVNATMSGGLTNVNYDLVCSENTTTTTTTFYKGVVLIFRVIMLYILFFLFWKTTDGLTAIPRFFEKQFNRRRR